MTPGGLSTEHARAWRAEVLGFLLVVGGILLHDHALTYVGASLVSVTAASYAIARAQPKAAAVRRPADEAARRV